MHSFIDNLLQRRQRPRNANTELAAAVTAPLVHVTLRQAELQLEARATRVISIDSLVLTRPLPTRLFRSVYPPIYRQN